MSDKNKVDQIMQKYERDLGLLAKNGTRQEYEQVLHHIKQQTKCAQPNMAA
ncbi:hypothetical protein [Loigolactobacillus coryniformis]|uniref:hypothetical protein n=1 Tax=Loigolactobacillus coryniformis TaxID=1610 RepID=UPI001C5DD7DB|nr:hypothetical protein [Loigolactobacillus coryniformis]MBW4801843.1 hypothetical protein [Loigolactobacillus coryniformis subsp. torquens]MBW4804544.1 hypothetical protein [Loigolactobacillus coryniformis subsp. torquens]